MTRQQARLHIWRELGLASGNALVTAGYVNDRIDRGQRLVALKTRWMEGTGSTQATASVAEYNVPTQRMFRILFLQHKNRQLDQITERDLYREDESWRTRKGQPLKWYQPDPTRIGLYPKPTGGSGGTLNFWANMTPTAVSSDTAALATPSQYHESLIYYVCAESMERLSEQDPDGRKQTRFRQKAEEHIALLKTAQYGRSGRIVADRNK